MYLDTVIHLNLLRGKKNAELNAMISVIQLMNLISYSLPSKHILIESLNNYSIYFILQMNKSYFLPHQVTVIIRTPTPSFYNYKLFVFLSKPLYHQLIFWVHCCFLGNLAGICEGINNGRNIQGAYETMADILVPHKAND